MLPNTVRVLDGLGVRPICLLDDSAARRHALALGLARPHTGSRGLGHLLRRAVLHPPQATLVHHLRTQELTADAHETAVEDIAPARSVEAVHAADAVEGLARPDEELPLLVVLVAAHLLQEVALRLAQRLVEHAVYANGWILAQKLTPGVTLH